jgi:basic membrane protein A
MKKIQRLLPWLLCLLLTAGAIFTGCETHVTAWKPGQPIKADKIKIGIVYLTDPFRETSGFTYRHYEGIKIMQNTLGLRDDQLLIKRNVPETEPGAVEHNMRELIMSGVHIIFAISSGYMSVCEKLSAEYPDVIFAHATGYKYNSSNFTNYYGKIHHARYLSGIVAGLRTKTNKVGFVAAMGMENSQVSSGLNAFAMGVESVNPEAAVYVRVVHNWFDPAGEILAARLLVKDGCDVIAQHTDTAAPVQEAQKAGVWAIGYNSDMSKEAPEAVLTSVIWNWEIYYTYLVKSVLEGTFTTEPYFGGIPEGLLGLSPVNEKLAAPGTMEAVAAAMRRLTGGNFNVFDGVMETNDGRRIGEEGGTFSDVMIKRDMVWYYRNIILR